MEGDIIRKCTRCKSDLPIINFNRKKNGEYNKNCIICLEKFKLSKINHKCVHQRRRNICKDCCGSSICQHQKLRSDCKECNDPILITIKTMIKCSKYSDKNNSRYDQTNFIDYCFVENLIEDCEDKCYYCKYELQYQEYTENLATIERIDNSIGHIKGNCVIACKTCNISRVGDRK
jgi:hypothetical protein